MKQYSKKVIGKRSLVNLTTDFFRLSGINNVLRYSYFYSGLRTGSGGITEINYRSTGIVNYRNTDTVRQKTALRQFSKTNKTPKPDNRNQYKTIKEISCRKIMSSQVKKTTFSRFFGINTALCYSILIPGLGPVMAESLK